MKQEKLNKLMKKIDKTKKPIHWKKFINENTIEHNIILKYGKRAFCTHCQKYFDEEVIIHNYKKAKCKWCGKEYYVNNCNKKNISFFKDIAYYTKVNNMLVLRIFEIESKYDFKTKTFKPNLQEFARFIPNVGIIINNAVKFYMWNQAIYHNTKITQWRIYTGKRALYSMPIYPHDDKELFKGTVFEYAPIKEFEKQYGFYTHFEVLQMAAYSSFELLWKMGLYNLSKHSRYFNKKGNFQKRFGVPKSFLKFMVDNNITFEDYLILKLIQEPNMELIKQYRRYNYIYLLFMKKQGFIKNLDIINKFYYDASTIMKICKYTSLKKLMQYKKGLINLHIYLDYLQTASKLGFSIKSKKRLFPYQLNAWHDKLCSKLKVMDDMNTQFATYIRYLELSKYTYEDEKYMIFPVPSVDAIKEEGQNQGNCVATNYLKLYIDKKTEIYFIRELQNLEKSFITLEYNDGQVIQKELPYHDKHFSQEQLDFIEKWCQYRVFMNKKEKYSKANKNIIKYSLNKMAA